MSCPGVVHCVVGGRCGLRRLPRVPIPWFPPYHLCLPHLKGWLLPILFSPFVFLTNVAALHGDKGGGGEVGGLESVYQMMTNVRAK